jgi:hypothetical protein
MWMSDNGRAGALPNSDAMIDQPCKRATGRFVADASRTFRRSPHDRARNMYPSWPQILRRAAAVHR